METYAEYFALRFVKDVVGDTDVFEHMVEARREEQNTSAKSLGYCDAVYKFGHITDDTSLVEFKKSYAEWVDKNRPTY